MRSGRLGAARPDLDILATDCLLVADGVVTRRYHEPYNPFHTDDQRRAILRQNWIASPAVRRRTWLDAGGYDESIRYGADWECWIRLILGGARAGLVDEPYFCYRQRPDSLTGARCEILRGRVQVLTKTRATRASRRRARDRRREPWPWPVAAMRAKPSCATVAPAPPRSRSCATPRSPRASASGAPSRRWRRGTRVHGRAVRSARKRRPAWAQRRVAEPRVGEARQEADTDVGRPVHLLGAGPAARRRGSVVQPRQRRERTDVLGVHAGTRRPPARRTRNSCADSASSPRRSASARATLTSSVAGPWSATRASVRK